MKFFVFLALLLSISFAACNGSISKYVPAVIGDGGGLVNVTMSLVPGDGTVYISDSPRTGLMTQDSIDQATSYASSLTSENNGCDILINFNTGPSTNFIDGPSAGTALTVMTYSLLSGKYERNDAIITGTIQPDGSVGPVGGVYEKAIGAATMGAKYFITPVQEFYEMFLLQRVQQKYGIQVLQAAQVEDVINFMDENISIDQQQFIPKNRDIPQLPKYDSSAISHLGPLTDNMIGMEGGLINTFNGSDNASQIVRNFFSNEVQREKTIESDGYLYSAANEAFLNYVDLSAINMLLNNSDLAQERGDVGKCLTGLVRPQMTDTNFEWVIGADLRQNWAYDKINGLTDNSNVIEDEKFAQYNNITYAEAWCTVANGLLTAAPTGGTPIDEGAWKQLAEEKIAEAQKIGTTSEDTATKLNTAQQSYQEGHYGAAIYDAVYVIQMEQFNQTNSTQVTITGTNRTSLWGNAYESHAIFLNNENQTQAALSTEGYAKAIDDVTNQMRQLMQTTNGSAVPLADQPVQPANSNFLVYSAGGIAIFLIIVVVILITSGNNGDNGKRSVKTYRTQQKKG